MVLGIAIIVAFTAITLMMCISLVYNSDIGEDKEKENE
jgi:hypothetical protein